MLAHWEAGRSRPAKLKSTHARVRARSGRSETRTDSPGSPGLRAFRGAEDPRLCPLPLGDGDTGLLGWGTSLFQSPCPATEERVPGAASGGCGSSPRVRRHLLPSLEPGLTPCTCHSRRTWGSRGHGGHPAGGERKGASRGPGARLLALRAPSAPTAQLPHSSSFLPILTLNLHWGLAPVRTCESKHVSPPRILTLTIVVGALPGLLLGLFSSVWIRWGSGTNENGEGNSVSCQSLKFSVLDPGT